MSADGVTTLSTADRTALTVPLELGRKRPEYQRFTGRTEGCPPAQARSRVSQSDAKPHGLWNPPAATHTALISRQPAECV